MTNLTLEVIPSQLPTSIGSEPLNKSKDASIAAAAMPPSSNGNSQSSTDVFEQAKTSFFSK